jgi:LCP family protein required for cell wall assembly
MRRAGQPVGESGMTVEHGAGNKGALNDWLQRRQRLSRARQAYRARNRRGLALPGRRPRLAYLFAIIPILAVVALLAVSPLLYNIGKTTDTILIETPISQQITSSSTEGDAPIVLPNWDKQDRINILLVGTDYREGDESSRTDSMIIASIDPKAKTVGILSLPRDLQVNIPGYGPDKLNAAYIYGDIDKKPGGGIGLLERTILNNFGVQIHYFGSVNFQGFVKIVDTFGGVTVDPQYAIIDDAYPTETYGFTSLYFPAGVQHLDGKAALQYARTRHADLDFGRSRRQQEVILSLRQQALKGNLIQNFYKLLDALKGSVLTDLQQQQIAQLANLGLAIPDGGIHQISLEDLMVGKVGDDGSQYLTGDWSAIRARVREIVPNAGATMPTPTPDATAKIAVQNGTLRAGFAARTTDRLKARGFPGATVNATLVTGVELPMAQTAIYEYGKADTAILAAKALGLTESAVQHATGSAPGGADILIVLGNDVADPGGQ